MARRVGLLRWMLLLALLLPGESKAQAERQVIVLKADGPLTIAMAQYLERGLARAEQDGSELLIFQLNTPGGEVGLTLRMVQSIRGSSVPVVVYVAPRGAIAGSAGTVITLAGHLAAMAPETAIGAASPVGGEGEDLGETIERKLKEMLKAEVRSLASRRGAEAVALAEATIEEARAVSAAEALEAGLIDYIAADLDQLLVQLDGAQVELSDGVRALRTSGAEIFEYPPSFIEQLLGVLTNPNLVFLLVTIGVQALLIEISSPGGWVAGFIGVACLALGVYGLGILPVNWFGIIFLVTSFVLFVLDIKAPTHGALTAAGLGSFILGALVLFNSPGTPSFQRVSVPLVIGTGVVSAALVTVVLTMALRAQRRPVSVGAEALLGRVGVAKTALSPHGTVQVAGELWSAEVEQGRPALSPGARVKVIGVEGVRIRVQPEGQDSPPS